MSVKKVIKFYYLSPDPCFTANGLNTEDLDKATYSIFHSAFPQADFYTMEFDKKNLFFDIKEYDTKKMFGTCSIDETIRPTSFVQKRNKNTKKATPFTTIGNEEQLESYTFFYIDFSHNRMAVIANKKIAKIHEALCQFIWDKSKNLSRITILPEMIEDVKYEANKLVNLSWLELEFGKQNCIDDIPMLKKALGTDFQAKRYQLKIRLADKRDSLFVDKLLSLKNNSKQNNLSELKLIGKNELGVDETINFFEAVYTKAVPLELTDDTATNIEYIKKCLENFLNLHLGITTEN